MIKFSKNIQLCVVTQLYPAFMIHSVLPNIFNAFSISVLTSRQFSFQIHNIKSFNNFRCVPTCVLLFHSYCRYIYLYITYFLSFPVNFREQADLHTTSLARTEAIVAERQASSDTILGTCKTRRCHIYDTRECIS